MFSWNSLTFSMIQWMLAMTSGSSAFSKSSLNIWKFIVHVLLKSGLENFEHHFANLWDECNYVTVWTFFGIDFLWDWNENIWFVVFYCILDGAKDNFWTQFGLLVGFLFCFVFFLESPWVFFCSAFFADIFFFFFLLSLALTSHYLCCL